MRVGHKLQQAGGPPLPLVAAMRGVDDKLPLWACDDGYDFIRGTHLINVTLQPQDIALSSLATPCLLSLWRVVDPTLLQPDLFCCAAYAAPLLGLPDCLPKLGDYADVLLSGVTGLSSPVLLDSIQSVWKEWDTTERNTFQLQWIATIVNSGILLGMGPQRGLLVECSGLGGAPIFNSIQGDLFLKCMPSAPVYGPTLAHLDVYENDRKRRHIASIGRTAQIHDFHMLHVAAWPRGVFAWETIMNLMNLPEVQEAKASRIMTQAGVLAAIGKKLPARLRDPHPGFALGHRLILGCLLPVPLRTYLTEVLTRELHVIGHSAGSFSAMVISDILQGPKLSTLVGCTRATAVALPGKLFETHYAQRKIHLYHVLEDELYLWRPSDAELAKLRDHGVEVTLITGNAPWLGKRNHSYGHLALSKLEPGTFALEKILTVPGVVPLFEKQKAPLHGGDPTTTDERLLACAQAGLPNVDTVPPAGLYRA